MDGEVAEHGVHAAVDVFDVAEVVLAADENGALVDGANDVAVDGHLGGEFVHAVWHGGVGELSVDDLRRVVA